MIDWWSLTSHQHIANVNGPVKRRYWVKVIDLFYPVKRRVILYQGIYIFPGLPVAKYILWVKNNLHIKTFSQAWCLLWNVLVGSSKLWTNSWPNIFPGTKHYFDIQWLWSLENGLQVTGSWTTIDISSEFNRQHVLKFLCTFLSVSSAPLKHCCELCYWIKNGGTVACWK